MNRYAHITFCDDIRQEVGGKVTQVGIYSGSCIVQEIPCLLPKLCFSLTLSAPKTNPIRSVQITAIYAGEEVVKMSLSPEQIDEIMQANPPPDPEVRQSITLTMMGVISPFKVSAPGRLKLNVIADDAELHCEDLEIKTGLKDQFKF